MEEYREMVSFQWITLSFLLVSGALFAYLIPHRPSHERHNRASVARRTYRNGEPPVGTYQHKDHPNLRQNHRPKDKSGHGNPVAQAGGHGEEYLPGHLRTLKTAYR